RVGGRPPSLKAEDLIAAKALLKDDNITVEEVAKRLSVAPSTLYRHLPGGRSSLEVEVERAKGGMRGNACLGKKEERFRKMDPGLLKVAMTAMQNQKQSRKP
ncbi:MAG: Hin recombinase, partial [Candidatus Paracaedibacteraceae bacterium]|nr:Hin recombinase [Candidatus Paracaedibacteraceae bacterium]